MAYYPERLSLAAPKGWRAKVDRLAGERDMSRAEYLRMLLRRAFEADRKRQARKGTK